MMMMTVPMMVVMMSVVMVVPVMVVMVVSEARSGVEALLDPAPAVPDRAANQSNRFSNAFLSGNGGNRCARQGLGAAAGKRSGKCQDGGEHQATHFE